MENTQLSDKVDDATMENLQNAFHQAQMHTLLLSDVHQDPELSKRGILPAVQMQTTEPSVRFPMSYTLLMQLWTQLDQLVDPHTSTEQAMSRIYSMAQSQQDKDAVLWFEMTLRLPEAMIYVRMRDLQALQTDCMTYSNLFTVTRFGTLEDLVIFRQYLAKRVEHQSYDHMRIISCMLSDPQNPTAALRDPNRVWYWARQFCPPSWYQLINLDNELVHQTHNFLMLKAIGPVLAEMEFNRNLEISTREMQLLLSLETMVILHKNAYITKTQEVNDFTAMSTLRSQADSDQEETHIMELIKISDVWCPVSDQIIQKEVYDEYTKRAQAPHTAKGPMFNQF